MVGKMNQEEIWKDIPGYEGLYIVSNFGNVKSLSRIKRGKNDAICFTKEHYLKPRKSIRGYSRVALYDNCGNVKQHLVHRLVAITFIDNPNHLSQVNHLNENKSDNRVSNLEWSTASHNINWGTRNNRVSEKMERALIAIRVSDGKKLYFKSLAEAKRQGHSPNKISKRIMCRHKGCCRCDEYIWVYADDTNFIMPKFIDKRKQIVATSIIDGNNLSFNSIREAARNGFVRNSIKRALNSKTNNIYKNYYWIYK